MSRSDTIARLKALNDLFKDHDGILSDLDTHLDDAKDLDKLQHKIMTYSMGIVPVDYNQWFNTVTEPFFYMANPEGTLFRRMVKHYLTWEVLPPAVRKISQRAKEDLKEYIDLDVAEEGEEGERKW